MKSLNPYQIRKKLLTLAYLGKYGKGLSVIEKYIEQHKEKTKEFLLTEAFFLYHYAAVLMYNKKNITSKKQKDISKYFNKAISICKNLILLKNKIGNKKYFKARMYLAQIYIMLGYKKKAEKIAIQTYKYYPSSLTAERVADIYMRMNNYSEAIIWYKKAVKKARLKTRKLIAQIGIAVCYKENKDSRNAIKEALIAYNFFQQSNKDKNAIILGKSLFAHFPEIKKCGF